ncbi:MAG: hypothetical protein ACRENK_15565 [Gemmatimonadaceae bacterium]
MSSHPLDEQRSIRRRFRMLVLESDPSPTKLTLCVAAGFLALGFWHDGDKCPYVACHYMERIMPWTYWGCAWTAYTLAESWRIIEGVQRPRIAWVVNLVGVLLFGGMGAAVTIARWPSVSLSAVNIALAAAACWVFARTAINPGHGFRGD